MILDIAFLWSVCYNEESKGKQSACSCKSEFVGGLIIGNSDDAKRTYPMG